MIGRMTVALAGLAILGGGTPCRGVEPDYPIRPVPAHEVRFTDGFWQPRLEVNRTVTIPFSLDMCEDTGRIENFRIAAGQSDGKWTGRFGFNDSDLSKILEGVAYSLMTHPDPALQARADELIALMAAAQEDDGYLETSWTARDTIDNPKEIWCCYPTKNKWLESNMSHELYNLGHMYESAVAYNEATGEPQFLDVSKKSAALLLDTFGPGKLEIPPGHPEIELGLVKLYRQTGDRRYLDLAKYFVDIRGVPTKDRPNPWGPYSQDDKPLREQDKAVGHAVRAAYLYAAATDVAALTGDQALADAVDRLWDNVAGRKTYVTGGIGATGEGEAFGPDYDLPNDSAYAETCAAIANCYWNHRMFLLHGDGKYIDVLERALYNGTISGVSLDGKKFFYPNPLASKGDYERSSWFDCSCCPTNICRFIPSVPGYAYATTDAAVWVNLFVEGRAELELADGKIEIEQETRYPWDGHIEITVNPATSGQKFALHVRIPGWARGQVWPTDLYRYLDQAPGGQQPTLSVGGEAVPLDVKDGYVTIDRAWQPGDRVTLDLPMPVRRVVANDQVVPDRGRVALMRGPIVYCVEWPEVEGGKVLDLVLPDNSPLAAEWKPDLLGGVEVVTGKGYRLLRDIPATDEPSEATSKPTHPALQHVASAESFELKPVPFTAIPYYAWAHRGKGEMEVWIARTADVLPQPAADQAE